MRADDKLSMNMCIGVLLRWQHDVVDNSSKWNLSSQSSPIRLPTYSEA